MLVYSVLRQKECFQNLADLKLPNGKGRTTAQAAAKADTPNGTTSSAAEENKALVSAAAEDAEAGAEAEGEVNTNQDSGDGTWAPTEAWLAGIKKKMPLQAILCLIDHLGPKIEILCKKNDVTDQDEVLKYLKQTTMVGILPVPHPIVIRTYQASSYTAMWFTSYMWGVIFTRSQRMPLYDWKKVKLVVINQ